MKKILALVIALVLALSLTAKDAEPTFDKYVDNLRKLCFWGEYDCLGVR